VELQQGVANVLTRTFIDNADKSNVATSRLQKQFEDATASANNLKKELEALNNDAFAKSDVTLYAVRVEALTTKIKFASQEAQNALAELSGRSDAELFKSLEASRTTKPTEQLKLEQDQLKKISEDRKLREQEITTFLLNEEMKRSGLKIQSAQESLNQEKLLDYQLEQQRLQHQLNIESHLKNDSIMIFRPSQKRQLTLSFQF